MKILFTGSGGFLGRNVIPLLKKECEIFTLDLLGNPNYYVNLALDVPKINTSIDVVVHAAGKAHSIPKSKEEEKQFYDVNLNGTRNLCYALENVKSLKSLIYISTVAVYGISRGEMIEESTPLLGDSAYARSKIEAETLLLEWCKKNKVMLSIIRPSLIAGPNPPGNLGSMINGIKTNRYLSVGDGSSRRSIVMVQDLAKVILLASQKEGIFNICDDKHPSYRELEILISSQLKKKLPMSISFFTAKYLAILGDISCGYLPIDTKKLEKLTNTLTFSNEKIKKELGYIPTDVLSNFIL